MVRLADCVRTEGYTVECQQVEGDINHFDNHEESVVETQRCCQNTEEVYYRAFHSSNKLTGGCMPN